MPSANRKTAIEREASFIERDAFFTRPETAREVWEMVTGLIADRTIPFPAGDFTWVEPSAGAGAFLDAAPAREAIIGLDIEPMHPAVIKQDFLEYKPAITGNWGLIGNPPFGNHGRLAGRFINHALAHGASLCAFILPSCMNNYHGQCSVRPWYGVHYSVPLGRSGLFHLPDGKEYETGEVSFQVWALGGYRAPRPPRSHPDFKVRLFITGTQSDWEEEVLNGNWDLCISRSNTTKRFWDKEDLPRSVDGAGCFILIQCSDKVAERIRRLDLDKMREAAVEDGNPVGSLGVWRLIEGYEAIYGREERDTQLCMAGI